MNRSLRGWFIGAGWCAWAIWLLSRYYAQIITLMVHGPRPEGVVLATWIVPALMVVTLAALVWLVTRPAGVHAARRVLSRVAMPDWELIAIALGVVPWLYAHADVAAELGSWTLPGLPAAGEAIARLGNGVIGAGLIATAAVVIGAAVTHACGWQPDSRVDRLLFSAATGVGVVSFASLMLAALHLYRPLPIAVALAAMMLLARAVRGPRSGPDRPLPDPVPISLSTSMWIGVTLTALLYGFVAAAAPEREYDALWYHLQLPRLWLAAGHPVDVVEEYVSLYPLTWELVYGDAMVLGGAVAAKLLHFACLPLIALCVMQAARRYLAAVPAAAAVAIAVAVPTVIWESSTAYVDLALTLHGSLACYALARYWEQKERPWAILATTQFGLAAATKHLGLFVMAIALGLFVVGAIRSGTRLRVAVRTAVLMGLLATALPAPWYFRAWRASGNPVFPEMYSMFGASPPQRWDALTERSLDRFKARFGFGRSPRALLTAPWNLTVHASRFGGSVGPIFLLLIPLAAALRRHAPAATPIAIGTALYLLLWASPISSFQLRFLMPIVPPLALLAAGALAPAEHTGVPRWLTPLVTALTMVLLVLNLPPFTRLHEADRGGWNGWLTHVLYGAPVGVVAGRVSEATYLTDVVPSWRAWHYINTTLPTDAKILTFTGGDNFYANRQRLAQDATMARSAVWGAAVNDLDTCVAALGQLGVTHVLFDRREMGRQHVEELAIASPPFLQACEAQFDDGRFEVCRIDYARLADARLRSER